MTRRWKVFLIVLLLTAGLGLAVFVGLIIYNRQFQLTWAKLDAARDRWERAAIADYDLDVEVSGGTSNQVHVQVRNGKAIHATANGRPLDKYRADEYWSVPGLFRILEADLKNDDRPGAGSVYTRVEFDPDDGHLIRYTRKQQGGGKQHIQIDVTLTLP